MRVVRAPSLITPEIECSVHRRNAKYRITGKRENAINDAGQSFTTTVVIIGCEKT